MAVKFSKILENSTERFLQWKKFAKIYDLHNHDRYVKIRKKIYQTAKRRFQSTVEAVRKAAVGFHCQIFQAHLFGRVVHCWGNAVLRLMDPNGKLH